jgi:hypothetical protein
VPSPAVTVASNSWRYASRRYTSPVIGGSLESRRPMQDPAGSPPAAVGLAWPRPGAPSVHLDPHAPPSPPMSVAARGADQGTPGLGETPCSRRGDRRMFGVAAARCASSVLSVFYLNEVILSGRRDPPQPPPPL